MTDHPEYTLSRPPPVLQTRTTSVRLVITQRGRLAKPTGHWKRFWEKRGGPGFNNYQNDWRVALCRTGEPASINHKLVQDCLDGAVGLGYVPLKQQRSRPKGCKMPKQLPEELTEIFFDIGDEISAKKLIAYETSPEGGNPLQGVAQEEAHHTHRHDDEGPA